MNLKEAAFTVYRQEVFNIVVTHLLTQGSKAMNSEGGCVYRANNGSKCAVGCLVSDDEYAYTSIEGLGVRDALKAMDYEPFHENILLLENLQHVHDRVKTESWEKALRGLADLFDFTMPAPWGSP